MRLPAYSASAKVICFIEKLGDWCPGILPNQEVFFRISLGLRLLLEYLPQVEDLQGLIVPQTPPWFRTG
ncbi:hypothetical protein BKM09_011790 [Pseudomonas amygdali pv. morsprunorum]|nr:hypothetical protein BKM09_011790 [Pseudomonas amygdali pv. morsprunorum]